MFFRKNNLCPKCRIGKESYELDKHSAACPYIVCWKNGKCKYFSPLKKQKTGFFEKLKHYKPSRTALSRLKEKTHKS